MSARFSSKWSMHVLKRIGKHRLCLRISDASAIISYGVVLFGLFLFSLHWLAGTGITIAGLVGRLGPHRTLFDKVDGKIKIRRGPFFHEYPLEQIQGIRIEEGTWTSGKYGYLSYRLELDFSNDFVGRMVISESGELAKLNAFGSEIAAFLNLPWKNFSPAKILVSVDQEQKVYVKRTPEEIASIAKREAWALKRATRKERSQGRKGRSQS